MSPIGRKKSEMPGKHTKQEKGVNVPLEKFVVKFFGHVLTKIGSYLFDHVNEPLWNEVLAVLKPLPFFKGMRF